MKKWKLLKNGKPRGTEVTDSMGISEEIAQIMSNIGITKRDDINLYLKPSFDLLRDPFLLKDMKKACDRIESAIEKRENICIYGDYDVDGVSSTSILSIYFRERGYPVNYYVPNRLEEGYGMNVSAVEYLASVNTDLIITVDCGITSVKEIETANSFGIDVIVTDHHECQSEIPQAYAVINPKQEDCAYPFKGICGCGVAFKLIHALSGTENFIKNIDKYLEITSLATVCDVMPLLDENRIIVKNGLSIMGKGDNLGMYYLSENCGLTDKKVKSSDLGFKLGPRINASGRLGFSRSGVELFTTEDPHKAQEIAEFLGQKNAQRQAIVDQILMEAEDMIRNDPEFDKERVILLAGRNWHHGTIGIVASRLVEKYYRPTILLCIEGDEATGSARSIKNFNIFESLSECSGLISKFGGHEQAAGLTVPVENIDELRRRLNDIAYRVLDEEDMIEEIKIQYEIAPSKLTLEMAKEIGILEPFGIGNPEPIFLMRNCYVKSARCIGSENQHLKLVINKEYDFNCIGFSKDYLLDEFSVGDFIDIAFTVSENTFNNVTSLQLMIRDIKLNRPSILSSRKELYREMSGIINTEFLLSNNNYDISEACDFLADMKRDNRIKRIDEIEELIVADNLIIVNTFEGYFRAKSDINISKNKKIDYIFFCNIDKNRLKRYNKIIIYDYLDNFSDYEEILKYKNEKTEIILNHDSRDLAYLNNKMKLMEFDRDNFVTCYKAIISNNVDESNIGSFIKSTGLELIQILIILEVLKDEKLIDYKIDYDKNVINFEKLPKPENKLDLNVNKIIKSIDSRIKKYEKTYR